MPTTLHELQQLAKLGKRSRYKVELCIDFDELETTPTKLKHPSWGKNSPYFCLVKDKRSYQDAEELWHVFPIALNQKYVWVACPICQCVHSHGNNLEDERPADWANHRAAHCCNGWLKNLYGTDNYDTSRTESGYDRHGYIIEKPNILANTGTIKYKTKFEGNEYELNLRDNFVEKSLKYPDKAIKDALTYFWLIHNEEFHATYGDVPPEFIAECMIKLRKEARKRKKEMQKQKK